MDLRSLRYFVSAAEQGSITAAADQCHVAQPSISNAIAQLESEFGLRLFSRGKKGVLLTPDGQVFLQEANRLLTSARQMEARFKATSRTPLQVGIHSQLASHDSGYLLQVVAKTLDAFRLDVQVSPAQFPDLWLTSARQCPTDYRFIPLLDQEYRLLAPKAWPIAKPVRLDDVLVYPWIDRLDCELREHVLELIPRLVERTQIKVDTEDLAMSLVRHRQGVTAMAVSDDIEDQWLDVQSLPLGDILPEPFRVRRLGVALHPKADPEIVNILGA